MNTARQDVLREANEAQRTVNTLAGQLARSGLLPQSHLAALSSRGEREIGGR